MSITRLIVVFVASLISEADQHLHNNVGIYSGNTISITEVPYMASIKRQGCYKCGAAIIHERFVLTALDCIISMHWRNQKLRVRVGTDNIQYGGEDLEVKRIHIYGNYNSTTKENDIVLVELSTSLTFGLKVNKVKLPAQNDEYKEGVYANVTGWGGTEDLTYESEQLRLVSIPIVSKSQCRYQTPNFLCVGESGKGAYFDLGGPLVVNGVQIGITVTSIDTFTIKPSVYINVSRYVGWIESIINPELRN